MLEALRALLKNQQRESLAGQKIEENHQVALEIAGLQGRITAGSSGFKWRSQLQDERPVLVGADNGVLEIRILPTESERTGFLTTYELASQELINFQEYYQDNGLKVWHVFAKRFAFLNPKYKLGVLNIYADILQTTREALNKEALKIGLVI